MNCVDEALLRLSNGIHCVFIHFNCLSFQFSHFARMGWRLLLTVLKIPAMFFLLVPLARVECVETTFSSHIRCAIRHIETGPVTFWSSAVYIDLPFR